MLKFKKLYNQQDPKWASILLGFNTSYPYNIGNYGCLITSLSIISEYYGYPTTPDQMNKKLKDINGFTGGGLYIWKSIEKIYPLQEKKFDTPSKLTDTQINLIKSSIDEGFPVMLQIDYKPATSALDMHYVVAIDYQENDFTIADPIDGTVKQLSKYSTDIRKLIWQFIILIGEVPETVDVSDLTDCEKKLDEMRLSRDEWKSKAKQLEKDLTDRDSTIEKLKTLCSDLEQKRNNLEIGNMKLSEDVSNLKYSIGNLSELNLEYSNTISKLQSDKPNYTYQELFNLILEKAKNELKKYL